MRLFLDANVLFSAAHSSAGLSRALFDLAPLAGAELWSSRFALDEAIRNLRLKSTRGDAALAVLGAGLRLGGAPVRRPSDAARAAGLPEKDVPILAGAIAVGADLLVTGDRRHFGALFGRSVAGVAIELPATAVERLLAVVERRTSRSRR